ncbi:lipopolysaccharide ABC transporter permease LptG [Vibrio cincinnatiensis]|uniref:Lipopolysaccharide export system permease protein n=1 Tax=Vibrio cincinnatiensis DSM 19608 TaxID=1123491 RepID=A0A1T4QS56_VIBCI|nr:LPS export ABC transporter permease LptG [Vibrio cincinnatiensis]MCG3722273.1 lipopolysaccharide ABC transporter permease LptG [Vibrio cincinnatiensis]MCG3725098.1 lipopolysaccharide ABC transporter permease LptG [Vibrio cincinnatiensis]MCG3732142.1 lipopolysaccharide ABC transporter permease LptG [Vibrio cincinnatiensis]MCG3735863.1 lipopolysaccharide ABC transporter permease LptG [Vibrio cincinnatiensis]MCG3739564.1 lipopolysaccharide ABC transporter permease LptG [Vibrio cincinnatiensis]
MFKILDWYIGRTIIATTTLVLVTFVGLSGIIKYVEQLRKVGDGTYDLLQALLFVVLSVPRDVEMFFPMAALLGALIGLGALAASSELVVMQAAGFSKLDIGLSVLKTAVPLMIIVTLLGEWGAPQAQKMARDMRAFATSGGNLMSVRTGVWARDVNDFIFVGKIDSEHLYGLNMWRFDEHKKLRHVVFAEQVDYLGDNQWVMKNVELTDFQNDFLITKQSLDEYPWKTALAPDKLAVVTVKPEELALSGLYDYVHYLKASEQDASRYELALWRKVTQPFSIAVMMLMALSFIFGPLRSVTMGARILSGVIAGFTFYISSEFFGPLSLVYGIPPVFGAVAPSLVFLTIAVMLLRRKL